MLETELEVAPFDGTISKIEDIDGLPTFDEARQLLIFLDRMFMRGHWDMSWSAFCNRHSLFQVFNAEFLDSLATEIRKMSGKPIIEICAGSGKLSHQLGKRGIEIRATDSYSLGLSKEANLVERLSHQEALEKYQPRIVVASWIPSNSRIGFDVLDFPSVKYFLDIGEDVGNASWLTKEIHERKDFRRVYLKKVEEFSICRTDYPESIFHSCVSLFTRKQAP